MIENIIELLEYNPMFDNCKDEINIIVEFASEMFYDTIMPERSEGETFETKGLFKCSRGWDSFF